MKCFQIHLFVIWKQQMTILNRARGNSKKICSHIAFMRSDVTQNITAVTLIVKNKDCINSTSYDIKQCGPQWMRVYDANNARTQCVIHFVLYCTARKLSTHINLVVKIWLSKNVIDIISVSCLCSKTSCQHCWRRIPLPCFWLVSVSCLTCESSFSAT